VIQGVDELTLDLHDLPERDTGSLARPIAPGMSRSPGRSLQPVDPPLDGANQPLLAAGNGSPNA
jgi:hypothetical protein